MLVKKRNGRLEEYNPNKINTFVERCCEGLNVSASEIILDAQISFRNKIPTSEIDHQLELTARSKIWKHPDYSKAASKMVLSYLYKEVIGDSVDCDTFEEDYRSCFIRNIKRGVKVGLFDEKLLKFDLKKLAAHMVLCRDKLYGYVGIKNLYDRYFAKVDGRVIETPQAFHMRVAMGLSLVSDDESSSIDEDFAIQLYEMYSQHLASPSTPTLFNSGTTHPQLSSCYLSSIDDSVDGIFDGLWQEARKSKYAGGLGFHMTPIRCTGSHIHGTNGTSSGLIPWLKIYNDMLVACNQAGRRPGSGACYIEPWHGDVEEFITLRVNTGDEQRKCRQMNIALWMPDLFFKRLEGNDKWTLFDPSEVSDLHDLYGENFEKKYEEYENSGIGKTISAKSLWKEILKCLFETSHPWICFKDRCNESYTNKHAGVVHGSNLCVSPETLLLTKDGFVQIDQLEGESVAVWNGMEWSDTTVVKTGDKQKLVTVSLSDGTSLDCTLYHKWYTVRNYNDQSSGKLTEKRTHELRIGDKLCKFDTPVISGCGTMKYPYTHGLFCAEGTHERSNSRRISLYDDKKQLLPFLDIKTNRGEDGSGRINVVVHEDMAPKFYVPLDCDIETKLQWLEGYVDGDGSIARNGNNESLQVVSVEFNFLKEVQLLLQTMGVKSKISLFNEEGDRLLPDGNGGYKLYSCNSSFRLLVSSNGLYKLCSLGFSPKRLSFKPRLPQRDAAQFVTVVGVSDDGRYDDTYCVKEPKRGMAVFNGVLTGNCTEITLRTKPPKYNNGKKTEIGLTAVCTLSSICLPNHMKFEDCEWVMDYDKIYDTITSMVKALDNVISINFYPTDEAKLGAKSDRPIGIGTIGWADVYARMGVSPDSSEAEKIANTIMEYISYYAINASSELATLRGNYSTFNGSLWNEGVFHHEIYNAETTLDWDSLRNKVKSGMRNSNLLAIAPNASIGFILGYNQSIEPYYSAVYTYGNKSGRTLIINERLFEDLERNGLWSTELAEDILRNEGDLTEIDEIPDKYKDIYKTAFNCDQEGLIRVNAVRQKWVDQAISFNLYNNKTSIKYLNDIYIAAWKNGLKTTYYLRNVRANSTEKMVEEKVKEPEFAACTMQEGCVSCEG